MMQKWMDEKEKYGKNQDDEKCREWEKNEMRTGR